LQTDVLELESAKQDKRFADNPVLETNHIRFYAGCPLITSDGYALGSLCVLGKVPRELNPDQKDVLKF
jgi:GAF domain-containing protein